jgi:nitroreductase
VTAGPGMHEDASMDMTPDELLTTTRSVRKRLDPTRPVPLGLVRECLDIALQAPSGSNRQGWHWMVVTDPQLRLSIGEYYRQAVRKYLKAAEKTRAGGQGFGSAADAAVLRRIRDSSAYLGEHMGDVPVQVIGCIQVESAWPEGGSQAGLWGSLLPAAWSFMLACRARGLGTAWTTLHLAYEREIAELLGLPENIRQGVLIPTAYYTGETFRRAPRHPLDEVVHLDRW